MAWTTPKTWSVDELVDASDFNTYIRDNQLFLLSGRAQGQVYDTTWHTTTSGTWVNMHSTQVKVTLSLTSSRVLVVAHTRIWVANYASHYGALALYDGTTRLGHASYGQAWVQLNNARHVTIAGIFTGLSAGSWSVWLQWRAGVSGQTVQVQNGATWLHAMEF